MVVRRKSKKVTGLLHEEEATGTVDPVEEKIAKKMPEDTLGKGGQYISLGGGKRAPISNN